MILGLPRLVRNAAIAALALALAPASPAQDRAPGHGRVHVQKYIIDADLDPATHKLHARAQIQLVPDEDLLNATFELNNNLAPTKLTDASGQAISANRYQQDGTIRVNFDRPLPKGQPATLNFEYDGTLASGENQPVEGLKLAYVGEPVSYLLYAGRWFPVSTYQVDRFAADLRITAPAGWRVVGPGRAEATKPAAGGKTIYTFVYDQPGFPGSVAMVREQAQHFSGGGLPVDVYFRGPEQGQAQTYAEAAGKIVAFYASKFGPAPVGSMSLVEIEAGSVNGYSAPGITFLSPRAIGDKLNYRLLAHEIAHQWWRGMVSPASRSDLWLDEGLASFSEMLYVEEFAGKAALDEVARDNAIAALTNDNIPIVRAGSLEEFTPEYTSVVSKKGAMVMTMLRWVIGDEALFNGLRQYASTYSGKSATTDDLRKIFEKTSSQNLQGFFIQWTESTGAPEFKADYTVFRVAPGKCPSLPPDKQKEGCFRISGKIKQDMDTFHMPVEVRVDSDAPDPEIRRVDVVGTASDFTVETFGRPRKVTIDPDNRVLKYSDNIRLQVAINKGQQAAETGDYEEALKEYQKGLDINRNSSLAQFRIGEVFLAQGNYQSAANAFREALNGDQEPRWTEVWAHINLGKIFDITGQRERAINEYNQAVRTRDDTQGAQTEARKYLQAPYQRERRESDSDE
jgi:aminopeptidase N